ncbi:hypothetical protein FJZ39_01605 [Candidatus Saccharibacteria bacterium]|nr:hypothetical protein [Candidatus Saccharibacteria bacterium]
MSSNTTTQSGMSTRTKSILGVGGAAAIAALVFGGAGTGADFTASDRGDVTVSTGDLTLTLANGDLDYPDLAPGLSKTDTFTVTNTGSVASEGEFEFELDSASVSGLTEAQAANLTVKVGDNAAVPVTQVLGATFPLGELAPDQSKNVDVTFALNSAAGNEWQNKSATGKGVVTLRQG